MRSSSSRSWLSRTAAASAIVVMTACSVPEGTGPDAETRAPKPEPSVVADADRKLDDLKIAVRGTLDGYSREEFPHWSFQSDGCNTRELVLKRDGENVRTRSNCSAVSGSWTSPYDGATWTESSDVDIDHMVPLAHAWISGAKSWPESRREEFANDLTRPQLLAVTDDVNREKSDQPPDEWKPPDRSYWCSYATKWITVKDHYELTITVPERTALRQMLDRC
jgi:hypothetical protein